MYDLEVDQARELRTRFTYHSPREDQVPRYNELRNKAHDLAVLILYKTPKCREQAIALTHLETAIMFANAAIARRE